MINLSDIILNRNAYSIWTVILIDMNRQTMFKGVILSRTPPDIVGDFYECQNSNFSNETLIWKVN